MAAHHTTTGQSDFFHVGGDSLALINLQAQIKDKLNVSVPLYMLFANCILSSMAAVILGPDMPNNVSTQANTEDWAEEAEFIGDVNAIG